MQDRLKAYEKYYSNAPNTRERWFLILGTALSALVVLGLLLVWRTNHDPVPPPQPSHDSAPSHGQDVSTKDNGSHALMPGSESSPTVRAPIPPDEWDQLEVLKKQLRFAPEDANHRAKLVDHCLTILEDMRNAFDHGVLNGALARQYQLHERLPSANSIPGTADDVRVMKTQVQVLRNSPELHLLVSGTVVPIRPLRGVVLRIVIEGKPRDRPAVQFSIAGNVLQDPTSLDSNTLRTVSTALLDPAPLDTPLATGDEIPFMFFLKPPRYGINDISVEPFLTIR